MAYVTSGTVYTIINKQGGTVVDLNQSTIRGAISDYGAPQQWLVEDAGSGLYYIRSAYGSKPYINVGTNDTSAMPCTDKKCAWKIVQDPADNTSLKNLACSAQFHLLSVLTPDGSRCMDLWGGSPNERIVTHNYQDGPNQSWIFNPIPMFKPPTQHIILRNVYTASLAGLDWKNKAVIGAPPSASANGIWEAEPVNKALNLYYIRNVSQGTYLSVQGEPSAGSPVFSTTTKQIWEIRPDALAPNPNLGQVVRIYYQSMNLMLDLSGGSPAPDTPIVMNTVTSPGTNQEWRIEGIIGSKE